MRLSALFQQNRGAPKLPTFQDASCLAIFGMEVRCERTAKVSRDFTYRFLRLSVAAARLRATTADAKIAGRAANEVAQIITRAPA